MPVEWSTPVGAVLTRDQRVVLYGGARYGGIEPSRKSPNVFVYSDPVRGETYGYNFDGWNEDHTAFLYTGEGQRGDQLMREGNKAIHDHAGDGRALRLFVVDGFVAGSAQKEHRYVGEFALDQGARFTVQEAPDQQGEWRTVFVFRLLPVGDVLVRAEDESPAGEAPPTTTATLVALETGDAITYDVAGTAPSTATRREHGLVDRYRAVLTRDGRSVRRWSVRAPGELRSMWTDLFDESTHELYEAKGTATRDAIRSAIGQLFDYRRHIADVDALSVLLPHRPSDDLVDLILGLGIACVYENARGDFERLSPPAST
jgi:5-methylcytosine-specific restriction protein A